VLPKERERERKEGRKEERKKERQKDLKEEKKNRPGSFHPNLINVNICHIFFKAFLVIYVNVCVYV
jgi:hypothetical protein